MAGRIPQDFIDHLLTRIDIVELIDSRVTLRKSGRNYSACCPFHNEKTPSFTVSPDKQFYHCFGCGAHGTAIGFLMDYDRLEFVDAVEELAQRAGLDIPREVSASAFARDSSKQHPDLLSVTALADKLFRRQLRQHPDRERAIGYLRGRGLDGETVRRFGIGYAPPGWDNLLKELTRHQQGITLQTLIAAGLVIEKSGGGGYDRFRDRIMFPIRDRRGRTIAFGGRGLDADATPKYLNSPETPVFQKGRELYGFFEARSANRQLQRLLVVEGYMDVVALAQHGIGYAVATLGTATTAEHLERLFRTCPTVTFCYDGDRAGRDAAWRALEQALGQLRDGRQASFLFLPEGEDPDTLVRQEGAENFIQRIESKATSLADYFFQTLQKQCDITTLDGRARLVELSQPLLAKLPESAFRDLMQEQLAALARMPADRLRQRLRQDPRRPRSAPTAVAVADQPAPAARIERFYNPQGTLPAPYRAIAILLLRGDLANRAGDLEPLRQSRQPELIFLIELIEILNKSPHINTAALIERYRGSGSADTIEALAQWQPMVEGEQLVAEFIDTMDSLRKPYADRRSYLLNKASQGQISPAEWEELRQLMKDRGKQATG